MVYDMMNIMIVFALLYLGSVFIRYYITCFDLVYDLITDKKDAGLPWSLLEQTLFHLEMILDYIIFCWEVYIHCRDTVHNTVSDDTVLSQMAHFPLMHHRCVNKHPEVTLQEVTLRSRTPYFSKVDQTHF